MGPVVLPEIFVCVDRPQKLPDSSGMSVQRIRKRRHLNFLVGRIIDVRGNVSGFSNNKWSKERTA
jgi:hypothetical protein